MGSTEESPVVASLKDPIVVNYNPPDGELNIWMYGMIVIGCAFVIFVLAGIYLMCNSPQRNEPSAPPKRMTLRDRNGPSGRVGKDAL